MSEMFPSEFTSDYVTMAANEWMNSFLVGGELRRFDHSGRVPVSPQPGHGYEEDRTVWFQLVHRWPYWTRAGTLPASRRHQGASFIHVKRLQNLTPWSPDFNLKEICVLHITYRFVILSLNGSKPLRSSTPASLNTPGQSASPTRTGREGANWPLHTHIFRIWTNYQAQ